MEDIVMIREKGRKLCLVIDFPVTNFSSLQTAGENVKNFRRMNGNFLVEIPVNVDLLPALGEIETWSECLVCGGGGYMPLFWPFSSWFKKCKKCEGRGGWWYTTN